MSKRYLLNLNRQPNGDYEVHHDECHVRPINNYEELGYFYGCQGAVEFAKVKHPSKRINGCIHCSRECHTS
jgi:hypothetical protein